VPIEAVIFDQDEVLCHYRIERRLELLSRWSGRAPDEIHAAIWRSGFEDASERGEMDADAYLAGFGERMGYPLTAQQWVEARRVAVEPNEAVLAEARRLAGRVKVAVLTNNGLLLKRHWPEVFPAVVELFGESAFCSAEFGCAKPDPEVFRRLAARLGVEPKNALFFDDGEKYVLGAREAGMHAHVFTGADDLRKQLAEHGLGD
jgi:HAD superfamily hydrolase (TIGR01509 family)